MGKSIYLAGKIAKGDWRHDIIPGLSSVFHGRCDGVMDDKPDRWPVLTNAVFSRYDYAGPFFVGDDHGCFHGENSHGVGAQINSMHCDLRTSQHDTLKWCMDAIRRADIFFAWIECTTCYGTLAEIGYAKALGKPIWLAGKQELVWSAASPLWFVARMADQVLFDDWIRPEIALHMCIAKYEYAEKAG